MLRWPNRQEQDTLGALVQHEHSLRVALALRDLFHSVRCFGHALHRAPNCLGLHICHEGLRLLRSLPFSDLDLVDCQSFVHHPDAPQFSLYIIGAGLVFELALGAGDL